MSPCAACSEILYPIQTGWKFPFSNEEVEGMTPLEREAAQLKVIEEYLRRTK